MSDRTDDRYRVAFDLAVKIHTEAGRLSGMESTTTEEYWLKLYLACAEAVLHQRLSPSDQKAPGRL